MRTVHRVFTLTYSGLCGSLADPIYYAAMHWEKEMSVKNKKKNSLIYTHNHNHDHLDEDHVTHVHEHTHSNGVTHAHEHCHEHGSVEDHHHRHDQPCDHPSHSHDHDHDHDHAHHSHGKEEKKQEKKALDLTVGPIWKVLIIFILPIMAGSLIQQLYTMVDAIVVGKFVGKTGLAAIDSVGTLFKFPINFLSGLSAGATIVISKFFGGKDEEELDCSIHTAYTIAIVLGVVCSVGGFLLAPALLNVMSVPEDIYSMTLIYVRVYFAGLWTMTLYNMVAGILRAFGDSKSPFYILIVCSIVNILGDLILVGLFHGGVAAAAIATIAAQTISAILAMRALSKAHTHCHEHVWQIRLCPEHMPPMLKIGLPLAFQSILFPIANSIVQASVNTMGTDTIAAWAVCGKLDMLIWLVADAMSPALSTYVAQNLGAGKKDRVTKGSVMGAGISAGLVAVISIILFAVPGPLGRLFVSASDAESLVPYVVHFMRMMAPFYIFYAFAEAFSGSCCGMGDTLKPMITTLICTCGLRVFSIFFIMPRFRSMECIIWIYIASWVATGLAFIVMFILKSRNNLADKSQSNVK